MSPSDSGPRLVWDNGYDSVGAVAHSCSLDPDVPLEAFYLCANGLVIGDALAASADLSLCFTASSESGDALYGSSADGLPVIGVDCRLGA